MYALILAGAAAGRFYNLGKRDFWYDEAVSGLILGTAPGEMMRLIIEDTHPPLYYLVAKPFGWFLGYSPVSLRLLSALAGTLIVALVMYVAKIAAGRRAAWYAGSLAAISPFLIVYAQEARMYALLGLLHLLTLASFIRAAMTRRAGDIITWGVAAGLSLLTHYASFISLAAYALAGAVCYRRLRPLSTFLPGVLTAGLILAPWLPWFIIQFLDREARIGWIAPATFFDLCKTLAIFAIGLPPGELSLGMPPANRVAAADPLSVAAAAALIFGAVMGAFLRLSRRSLPQNILFVHTAGTIGAAYALSLYGENYFVARYLIGSGAALSVIFGIWLAETRWWIAGAFLCAYAAVLALTVKPEVPDGYRILKSTLSADNGPVYVLDPFEYVIAAYYFGRERVVLYNINDPRYNPRGWAGIWHEPRRLESLAGLTAEDGHLIIRSRPYWSYENRETEIKRLFGRTQQLDNLQLFSHPVR